MKIILASILFILFGSSTYNCYGQRIEQKRKLSKQEYFDRSIKQKNAAIIFVTGGTLAVVGGAVIFERNFDLWDDANDDVEIGSVVAMGVGAAAMISSIFLFSQSMANKEISRELSAFIKVNQALQIRNLHLYYEKYPAAGISWYMFR